MLKIKRSSLILICVVTFTGIARAGEIEVYFSPRGNCIRKIIQEIAEAKETLDIAMYYFTSAELANALVETMNKGVKVRVYLDEDQETAGYSKSRFLINNGIPVRFESGRGLMHNKFCVIDGKTIITGSYNWTQKAEQENDENLVILRNPDVAKIYQRRFKEYWGQDRQGKEIKKAGSQKDKQKTKAGEPYKNNRIEESIFLSGRPPLLNFDVDLKEEFADTEDDELETGEYKYLSTAFKLDQRLNFRLDYSAGVKQGWKKYARENKDNQVNGVFLDLNYRLSESWTLSWGAEDEIKRYRDIDYSYNRIGLWTGLEFAANPWKAWFKTGYYQQDYKDAGIDKTDINCEMGMDRYLWTKDTTVDMGYKFKRRQYSQEGRGDEIRQSVHLGIKHQF